MRLGSFYMDNLHEEDQLTWSGCLSFTGFCFFEQLLKHLDLRG